MLCGWDTPETALGISGVAHPEGGRPAVIFNPFGHPTPYAHRGAANLAEKVKSS
jgi:hypothetical protein